ncbi:MAG: methylated-DNA--[protein]-cysteine S-methyltransferase [Caldilineaceae bacterium]|nr:methylated-DNA--[protein]-cysteine S-methyltransferase [Caldilineaceae bacterium]
MNYDSPIGSIEIHATDTAVSRVEFAGEQGGEGEEVSGVGGRPAVSSSQEAGAHPLLGEVRRQLDAYFAGDLRCFDLPLGLEGTPFQRQVWQQLLSVGYGQTASYQDIAVAIDNPKAVRAVGAANGRNPVAIIVPCHRIIGSGGRAKLTGYGGGVWRKEWLLRHEGVLLV